jgi:hypothetical protein
MKYILWLNRLKNWIWQELSKLGIIAVVSSLVYLSSVAYQGLNYISDIKRIQEETKARQVATEEWIKKHEIETHEEQTSVATTMKEYERTNTSQHDRINDKLDKRFDEIVNIILKKTIAKAD